MSGRGSARRIRRLRSPRELQPCRSAPHSIRFSAMADGSISSPDKAPHPAWVRLLLPSVVDIFFVALLSVLVFTSVSVRLLGDAGIGWHIRTGQQIVTTHAIPRVDPFSSTMHGKPWFAWEWMYDVLVGQLERTAGVHCVWWVPAFLFSLVLT